MDDTEGSDPTRRRVLQGSAVLAAGLAGCIGGDDGDDGAGSDGEDGTGTDGEDGAGSDGDTGDDGGDDTSDTDDDTSDGDDGDAETPTETPTPSPTPDDPPEDIETEPLPEEGDDQYLGNVESFESEGTEHVSPDEVDWDSYDTMPPTSGPHTRATVRAGFYSELQPVGATLHTLEHGAVVVYYDPDEITDDARESLEAFASEHTGTWTSFVAVPHPEDDPDSPYVLTAWQHILRMDEYDPRVVRAFTAEYLGRGPEHQER